MDASTYGILILILPCCRLPDNPFRSSFLTTCGQCAGEPRLGGMRREMMSQSYAIKLDQLCRIACR